MLINISVNEYVEKNIFIAGSVVQRCRKRKVLKVQLFFHEKYPANTRIPLGPVVDLRTTVRGGGGKCPLGSELAAPPLLWGIWARL